MKKNKIENVIHTLRKWNQMKLVVKKFSNIHIKSQKPDIFLFSTPRSGSTFLEELFHTQRGIKKCDEPFNLRNPLVREASKINKWEQLLPNENRERKIKEYIHKIKTNKVYFLNQIPFTRNYKFMTDRIVFKVIHAGEDMVNWFKEEFSSQIVYLIRHPIPVTLSRKVYPRLEYFLQNEIFCKYFTNEQIRVAKSIITKGTNFERGILSWCLQNFVPLNRLDRSDWIFVTYEDLVLQPDITIDYLSKYLNIENPEVMIKNINQPSRVLNQSDQKTKNFFDQKLFQTDRKWLVEKWKEKVTPDQEEKAFDLLSKFQIDAYEYGEFAPSNQYSIKNKRNT